MLLPINTEVHEVLVKVRQEVAKIFVLRMEVKQIPDHLLSDL